MTLVIEQVFLLGRFHATRWNQNPFEDRAGEWPPSPWRLIRTLAARWFQYQRETGDDNTKLRDELLRALAAELPSFRLPEQTWRGNDLRQYQPTALDRQYKYRKNPRTKKQELDYSFREVSRTLALDTYRAVPPSASIYWIWSSCTLSNETTELLRQLLRRIHYFGRAEAWTTMRLVDSIKNIVPNCELKTSRSSASVAVLAQHPGQKLDIDLLLAITGDKQLSNRRTPPGTSWFHAELPPRLRHSVTNRALPQSRINVTRYALDSTVLPLVTETLPVAESARRALMGTYGRLAWKRLHGNEPYPRNPALRPKSEVFSGKDARGNHLKNHVHSYYLPTDEDGDGRLDHLTVYASRGFGLDERRALDHLHKLKTGRKGEESHPLRLLLLGMGVSEEYCPGPLKESNVWVSATPYIATRYAKTRGRNRIDLGSPEDRAAFLQDDLRAQLAAVRPDLTGEAVPDIEPLWDDNHTFHIADRWRTIQFKRFRRKAGDDGGRRLAGAFKLTFSRPVQGPIALGWSSHFGLGLFAPHRGGRP